MVMKMGTCKHFKNSPADIDNTDFTLAREIIYDHENVYFPKMFT